MRIDWKHGFTAVLAAAAVVVSPVISGVPGSSLASGAAIDGTTAVLHGLTPNLVLNHQVLALGAHNLAAPLSFNVALPLSNQAALDDFIANDASRGIFMTQDQFNAEFGVSQAQVQAVLNWAAGYGIRPTYVSPDGSLITFRGATALVERALNVQINDYRKPQGDVFYANNADPTLPASLGITTIDGLNNLVRFRAVAQPALRSATLRGGGYYPSDFRAAYDLAGHGYDGTGQTIGLTLWGTSVANSDLTSFCATTQDACMSAGTGADQIEWIPTNGGSNATDALLETAMDVEYAHGMAQHAHLKYWLGDEVCDSSGCGGSDVGLEDAISLAANDGSLHAVSNSWGGGEAPSTTDPFVAPTTASFQHAVATGTTFYFSSGDNGSDSGGTGEASYPADSPYVVSVGGTHLTTGTSFAYAAETTWSGEGTGCSTVFSRPSWQVGVTANQQGGCSTRSEPDVSADADPNTGAYVYVQGSPNQVGGTSLSAPLFAGMMTVANRYATLVGHPISSWAAPLFYQCGFNTIAGCSSSFHDVASGTVTGSKTYTATTGWDQATGWGSLDWWQFVQKVTGAVAPTPTATVTPGGPTATNTPIPSNTPIPTNTAVVPNGITNGGFESALSGWTSTINHTSGNAESAPTVSTVQHHSGSASLLVGVNSTSEPNGDACVYQNFNASAGSYSFWYLPFTTDSISYDWQEAYLRASGTNGCSESGTQLLKVASNSGAWTQVSQTIGAGSYQAYFNVHEDGYGDPTYMYLDDVTAPAGSGGGPSSTPTSTFTPPPTPTRTFTATPTFSPTRTATPIFSPTSTATPIFSATRTATPIFTPTLTATPVNTPVGGSGVSNGGFESALSGWTSTINHTSGNAESAPTVSTVQHHSGSASLLVGVNSTTEPNGDACVYQNFSASGSTYSFWYLPYTTDSITYDWQEAYLRASGTNGCSESGTQLLKVASNSQVWTQVSRAVTTGAAYQAYFNVHEDGYGDPTYMYLDDVTTH